MKDHVDEWYMDLFGLASISGQALFESGLFGGPTDAWCEETGNVALERQIKDGTAKYKLNLANPSFYKCRFNNIALSCYVAKFKVDIESWVFKQHFLDKSDKFFAPEVLFSALQFKAFKMRERYRHFTCELKKSQEEVKSRRTYKKRVGRGNNVRLTRPSRLVHECSQIILAL